MANDVKQSKRRRHRAGVPTALVIVLMVIAIVMGGLAGFAIARRTAPVDDRLQQANERIIELENTLMLTGFPIDGDPENWVFDDNTASSGASDLAGVPEGQAADGESELWTDDGDLLTGALKDDGDPVVVAEFNGGQLLSTEVIPEFNDQLSAQVFAGYSAEEVSGSVLQEVMSTLVGEKLMAIKAHEQGLDQLSDEDMKQIEAQADQAYREQLAYYAAFVTREGMTQQEIDDAAEAYMRETDGVTRESIVEAMKQALPIRKYREQLVSEVTVNDQEVNDFYQTQLAEQKDNYTKYPEEYEYAHIEGETILYNPEGYRGVRNLLLAFEGDAAAEQAEVLLEQISRLSVDSDAEEIRKLEQQLDPLYQPLEEKAAEISEKLKNGESFLSLMDQYGMDELMQSEPLRTQGYYLSDRSFLFSTEFIEGTMILERPGQVSTPLRSSAGVHMTQYAADVTPGEVALDAVREAVQAEALAAKQEDYYQQKLNEMLDEANVQYYPERLQ